MKRRILTLFLCLCAAPFMSIAQQAFVTGKVVDDLNNEPLPGVNVLIKGTTQGAITDIEGNFRLEAAPEDVLIFSYIGYLSEEVEVGNQTTIDLSLVTDILSLNELIVTGYSAQKKKDLTGAVSVVDLEEIEDQPAGNLMKNIQGRVAGVLVTGNGRPGDGGATVRIRGLGSPFSNSDPLYVIDGVPTQGGMHEINPNDIESVQVLKDAASASIYGARAANGVVIVTTKKGRDGAKISLRSNVSVQQFHTNLDPLNTEERARVYWQARVNDGQPGDSPNINTNLYNFDWNGDYDNPVLNNIYLPEFIDNENTMRPANTNWYDEVTETSIVQDHNISVSDGSERGNFLISLGYFDHDGVVRGSNFERISGRINSEYKLFNNRVRIGENFAITNQRQNQVNDEAGNIMFLSLTQHSILPVRTINGQGYGGPVAGMTDRDNPVRLIEDKIQNVSQFNRVLGNVFVDVEPIENLVLRSSLGVDYNIFNNRILDKAFQVGSISGEDKLTSVNNRYGSVTWTNTALYNLSKGRSQAQFLVGTEQIKFTQEDFSASRRGFVVQDYDFAHLSNGTGEQQTGGFGTGYALQSFFGKVDYSFDDRYLASFTLRRDGSSRFGQNNRYGNFPSASVGWRISEEAFMEDVKPISDLKLRASWGQTGNQAIDDRALFNIYRSVYATQSLFTAEQDNGTAYDINGNGTGNLPSGFSRLQTANPNLQWETTTQGNIGLDFSLFDYRFTGSVDAYLKRTTDFLFLQSGLGAQGEGANRWVNVPGISEDRGVELTLGYNTEIGDLQLNINGNITFNENEAKDLPADIASRFPGDGEENTINGRAFNSIYGFVADGLFQSDEEVEAHASQSGAAPGRIRYKDLNGDGEINEGDQQYIGITNPRLNYGLNVDAAFKNFTLNIFFQGVNGGVLRNDQRIYTDFASQWVGANWGGRILNAWTPENNTSDIPAVTLTDNNNEGRTSTYFLEPLSYLKLRNVQLGYALPESFTGRLKMASARVFIQGQNLITINSEDSTIPDPETPNGQFPIPRVYTMGINVTF